MFGAIILVIIFLVGLYFLSKWIVRKMLELREDYDIIEVPDGFWQGLLVRFVKGVFRTADRIASWFGRISPFLASPLEYAMRTHLIFLVLGCLVFLFASLSSRVGDGINFWMILGYVLFLPLLFQMVLPREFDGNQKRYQYDLTWGDFLVYSVLFGLILLLLVLVLILLFGWAIASNEESSSANRANNINTEVHKSEVQSQDTLQSSSPQQKEPQVSTPSNTLAKSNPQTKTNRVASSNRGQEGKIITVDCPKCGKAVVVNCRFSNGQSSDTGQCRNCGRLVYVLYENSSFGFRIIRVW